MDFDFEHYAEQGLSPGRTLEYEVTELRNQDGTHPLLHVEHLGETNVSFYEYQLARAGAEEVETVDAKVARSRELVANHAVRRMERVFLADGSEAPATAISAFVHKMPLTALRRLFVFVSTEGNFVKNTIAAPPAELAEKS